jgi:hypothetical protein
MGNYMLRAFEIYSQRRKVEQAYRLLWQTVQETPNVWPAWPDWISTSAQDQLRRAHAMWAFTRTRPLPPEQIGLSPEVEYQLHGTYTPSPITASSATPATPDNWPAILRYYRALLGPDEPILPP